MSKLSDRYTQWQMDPTPVNMGGLMRELDPILVQEVQNYPGPKDILHIKSKRLAMDAIKSYDPTYGANLRTWVTNQLKPLSRYGKSMEAVRAPEVATRRAAEINRIREELHDRVGRYPTDSELADETGVSIAKIHKLRAMSGYGASESQYASTDAGDPQDMPSHSQANAPQYAQEAVYAGLDPREKVIFDWKTGSHGKEELSNAEIAARLGVSPAFISQVSADIARRVQKVIQDAV